MKINRHKYRYFSLFFLLFCVLGTQAQELTAPALALDTIAPTAASATVGAVEPESSDSLVVDLSKVQFSKDGLTEEIAYNSKDSMWFDVSNKQVHLYGEASIKYTSLNIKAGYILLDYGKNEVLASTFADTSGALVGTPEFEDKDQSFTAAKLRYNFKTKKGIIYEARTKQEDLYVLGQRAKFIGPPEGDTITKNIIYNSDAIITTCDAAVPHFGIHTRKLKVIPDKLVVTGLSNLEISGIPTPFVLPFGFYPITKTRKAGVIIPQDFNFAEVEGFGLQNFGWYQPINDHLDATVLFNAYVSGTWGVDARARYSHKYKNSGTFSLRYNKRVNENAQAVKIANKSFGLTVSHNQDSKAHPTRTFGGSVNIETNRDQNRNQNDFVSVYQNQLSSNLRFSKTFPGKPFQFNAGFTHSQNTKTRKMNITLPEVTFTMQRIFPFKNETRIGKEKWYEKVSLTYNAQLRNAFLDVPDTTLFTAQTLRNVKSGVQHRAATDFNLKVLKYINITPNINYEENWYPYVIEKQFINEIIRKQDTIRQDGEIIGFKLDSSGTVWGRDTLVRNYRFNAYRTFNAGISASTSLFATKQWSRGWLRGIRHKITPSVSIGFGPDYSRNERIFKTARYSSRPGLQDDGLRKYSIYDEGIYSRPSSSSQSMILNYSLLNVLEMKHASKRDTTGKGKKIKIFDNLNFTGSYNFSADSLKWSPVGTNGVFRLFKGVSTINWSLRFDPYSITRATTTVPNPEKPNETITKPGGTRVNQFYFKETGKILRTDQISLALNTNLTVKQLRDLLSGKGTEPQDRASTISNPKIPDTFWGWVDNFSITHYIGVTKTNLRGIDTVFVNGHNLSLQGNIPLSAKWQLNLSNISYDVTARQLVYPVFGITRDLHCWEMRLSWQPDRGTYNFYIAAKPGTFSFLKAPYRKNNFDGSGAF